ncbi:hypothetical protein ACFL0B_04825 [Thermodesulfobacteriota bacterium]|jgi:hypothetical protein|nr:hypothetical protein [Desulfobulbales bacterium]
MINERDGWTMQDIQKEMPLSDTWLRSMEDAGFLKLESPRVRGQVKRLFSQRDVVNVLWLASLRILGYGPKYLRKYKKVINNLKKIVRKHLKKEYNAPADQVFLFDTEDFFPNGDLHNIDWDKINPLDKFRLSDALSNLYEEASWLQLKAQTTQKHLKKVEKNMGIFMNQIEQLADNVPYIEIHRALLKGRAQLPEKKE